MRHALTRHSEDIGPRLRALRAALAGGRTTLGDIVGHGFVAVVAFELAGPFYAGPTKEHLNNTEAYRLALAVVRQGLERFTRDRPDEARTVEAFLVAAHVDPKSGMA